MQWAPAQGREIARTEADGHSNGNGNGAEMAATWAAGPKPSRQLRGAPVMSTRRRFSPEYKLRILEEADQCSEPGELAELLRREGIYSSYLTAWRRQRDEGVLAAAAADKPASEAPFQQRVLAENERLVQANADLQDRLRQAQVTIALQKKILEMVGALVKTAEYGAPAK